MAGLLVDGLPEPEKTPEKAPDTSQIVENTSELYRKFRPTTFNDVEGQDEAVKAIKSFIKEKRIPHAILFAGPSGTGKTTLARILRAKMQCNERNDFFELNAAEKRGIDDIRDIMSITSIKPMCSPCRIWLIDECQKLTDDAQGALLKALENAPPHAYFMLATTHPKKLRTAIRTRCTTINLVGLSKPALKRAVQRMADLEGRAVDEKVLDKLCEVSEGSARMAIVKWDAIKSLPTLEEQLKGLELGEELEASAYKMAQLLMNANCQWSEIQEIISALRGKEGEDPEGLRNFVLKYATTTILGRDQRVHGMAASILTNFEDNRHWEGIAGWASLCRAAYTVFRSHKK